MFVRFNNAGEQVEAVCHCSDWD